MNIMTDTELGKIMLEKARSSRKYANTARNKARESFAKNRR